ncbi:MAG: 5'/3'-nucleotidase SurE [Anaeroplasma sp.]
MNFLVVNDDGIEAEGINILVNALAEFGNVYVSAPDSGRSASSHSIILHKPIDFVDVSDERFKKYKVSGMPSDCVRLATAILDVKFDVVFSGINNGLNIGTDIIYSGTVAAAREGLINGIPSVAISTDFNHFDIVKNELNGILKIIFNKKLYSNNYVLNVNFPIKDYKKSEGIKICRQGIKIFKTIFEKNGPHTYITASEEEIHDMNENTDVYYADKGYVTIVPLQLDQTYNNGLDELGKKLVGE